MSLMSRGLLGCSQVEAEGKCDGRDRRLQHEYRAEQFSGVFIIGRTTSSFCGCVWLASRPLPVSLVDGLSVPGRTLFVVVGTRVRRRGSTCRL